MSTPRNALDAAFAAARARNRSALVPYLTAGFPQPAGYVELAVGTLEAGADALEIGIPFSDPLLDGPSIQRSQQRALEAGVTPARCLEYAGAIHARSEKPLVFMGAYNPILAYGVASFCRRAAEAGVTGLIVPDVPFEEQEDLLAASGEAGLHLIQLVAPTSTQDRLERACALASGFVYCISVSGVTGARAGVAATARPLVERVKSLTTVPVALGFGIGSAASAREAARFADGVIVGAALIDRVAAPGNARQAATEFVRELAGALQRDPAPA